MGFLKDISEGVQNPVETATGIGGDIQEATTDTVEDVNRSISQAQKDPVGKAQDAAEEAADTAEDVVTAPTDAAQDVADATQDVAEDVKEGIQNEAEEKADTIVDRVNAEEKLREAEKQKGIHETLAKADIAVQTGTETIFDFPGASVQEGLKEAAKKPTEIATGEEVSDQELGEAAEETLDVFEGAGAGANKAFDEAQEGTVFNNPGVDAAQGGVNFVADAFVKDAASAVSETTTGIDPETGETENNISTMELFDAASIAGGGAVKAVKAGSGAGSITSAAAKAKSAKEGAKSMGKLDIFTGGRKLVDEALSGGDEAISKVDESAAGSDEAVRGTDEFKQIDESMVSDEADELTSVSGGDAGALDDVSRSISKTGHEGSQGLERISRSLDEGVSGGEDIGSGVSREFESMENVSLAGDADELSRSVTRSGDETGKIRDEIDEALNDVEVGAKTEASKVSRETAENAAKTGTKGADDADSLVSRAGGGIKSAAKPGRISKTALGAGGAAIIGGTGLKAFGFFDNNTQSNKDKEKSGSRSRGTTKTSGTTSDNRGSGQTGGGSGGSTGSSRAGSSRSAYWSNPEKVRQLEESGWFVFSQQKLPRRNKTRFLVAGKKDGETVYLDREGTVSKQAVHYSSESKVLEAYKKWKKKRQSGDAEKPSAFQPSKGKVSEDAGGRNGWSKLKLVQQVGPWYVYGQSKGDKTRFLIAGKKDDERVYLGKKGNVVKKPIFYKSKEKIRKALKAWSQRSESNRTTPSGAKPSASKISSDAKKKASKEGDGGSKKKLAILAGLGAAGYLIYKNSEEGSG